MDTAESTQSHLDRLGRAQARRELVTIVRDIDGADRVIGYVVAIGMRWALVSVIHQSAPNGWVALQVADVIAVEPAPGSRFVRRGLEFQQCWPATVPQAPIALDDSVQALITSATSSFPLLTLYLERQEPASCIIGRPVEWTSTHVRWRELTAEATWDEAAQDWEQLAITRVDLGGQYEIALTRVAELRA